MTNNKTLINYYARLIQKNNYTIEKVPEEMRDDVIKKLEELPPLEHDPITQTPEEK